MHILKTVYKDGVTYTACQITDKWETSCSDLVTDTKVQEHIDERHQRMGLNVTVIEWQADSSYEDCRQMEDAFGF